jgi:hypothetical protein
MNGKWSKENFKIHCRENPQIYEMFKHYALRAAKVRNHYSAKTIFHIIRWQTQIKENNSDFKIDDGWISHYARRFMDDHPEYEGFFETRIRRNSYHDDGNQQPHTRH